MKTLKTTLICLFILLITNTISAQQYGNNNNYGGGRLSQMNEQSQQSAPEEIPIEVTVGKIMDEMKPAVNLDDLQVIAISNVLIESMKTQGILLKQKFSQDDQIKNFQALSETTDRKIMGYLSAEQKEKYLAFKETRKNPKKSKKKNK